MTTEHQLPTEFLRREIVIHVIGCGGTGSQLLPRLPLLHKSIMELGHPKGLKVHVWDDDVVESHNVMRQNFFAADVGSNKARVMVNRLNIAHGLNWQAHATRFTPESLRSYDTVDFLIGAVDSRAARRDITAMVSELSHPGYWIDAGNEADSGQVVVGQFGRHRIEQPRLPLVSEEFPEIISGEGKDDNTPSCSARESILRQGLATNGMAAMIVYGWLAEALRHGKVSYRGAFFNVAQGRVSPLSIPASSAVPT